MVLILIGPMGCGKTTIGRLLAGRLGWSFHDGDDFHPKTNVEKMRAGIPLTDADRKDWLGSLRFLIEGWAREGRNTILACSALKQVYRKNLGVEQDRVKTVYLKGTYELLRRRIEQRRHPYMNKDLLRSQLESMEEPSDGLTVSIAETPDCIVERIISGLGLRQI